MENVIVHEPGAPIVGQVYKRRENAVLSIGFDKMNVTEVYGDVGVKVIVEKVTQFKGHRPYEYCWIVWFLTMDGVLHTLVYDDFAALYREMEDL